MRKINYIENKVGLIKGLFYKSELAQSLVDESVAKLKSELMWNKFGLWYNFLRLNFV